MKIPISSLFHFETIHIDRVKNFFWLMLSVLLAYGCLTINTLGFDFYHHASTAYSLANAQLMNHDYTIGSYVDFPRYMLATHAIYLASQLGLPVAISVSLLNGLANYRILCCVEKIEIWKAIPIAVMGLYSLIFFSFFNTALLFFVSGIMNSPRERWGVTGLILSCALSPLFLMLTFFYLIVIDRTLRFLFAVLFIFAISLLVTYWFPSETRVDLLEEFFYYSRQLFGRLLNIFGLIIFGLVLFGFYSAIDSYLFRYKNAMLSLLLLIQYVMFYFVVGFIYVYKLDRPSVFSSLFNEVEVRHSALIDFSFFGVRSKIAAPPFSAEERRASND